MNVRLLDCDRNIESDNRQIKKKCTHDSNRFSAPLRSPLASLRLSRVHFTRRDARCVLRLLKSILGAFQLLFVLLLFYYLIMPNRTIPIEEQTLRDALLLLRSPRHGLPADTEIRRRTIRTIEAALKGAWRSSQETAEKNSKE